jgi:hypothetical protein
MVVDLSSTTFTNVIIVNNIRSVKVSRDLISTIVWFNSSATIDYTKVHIYIQGSRGDHDLINSIVSKE